MLPQPTQDPPPLICTRSAAYPPFQAQVSAKASRQEVVAALSRAMDVSVDTDERLRLAAWPVEDSLRTLRAHLHRPSWPGRGCAAPAPYYYGLQPLRAVFLLQRQVAEGLDAVSADVETRAPRERVAELEYVLSQARPSTSALTLALALALAPRPSALSPHRLPHPHRLFEPSPPP